MKKEVIGRAKGGVALAEKMTVEQRKAKAMVMVEAKKARQSLPNATHGSSDKPLKIGNIEISCYVLENGMRVLSQSGLQASIGMSLSGGLGGEQRIATLLSKIGEKGIKTNDLIARIKSPILFIPPHGGNPAYGFEATILADLCDILLVARSEKLLSQSQLKFADQSEILVRGFARVGIIALVDEATGYQKDRERNALAKILEAFVAKELQPYLKTFPTEYYENLFRIYGYEYPPKDKRPQWRPAFFGHITNNVIYARLAPDLLPELKKTASKIEKKTKLHSWLTNDIGHPKLREHLASIVTLLKLSKTKEDFFEMVDKIHPEFNKNYKFDFTDGS
jgi:hypothetical protein